MDIFSSRTGAESIGIQCKNTTGKISAKIIIDEIKKAEQFVPPLTALYIATTRVHDGPLQEKIRLLSAQRTACGKFPVNILFWDEIIQDLAKDEQDFFKHFPTYATPTPAYVPPSPFGIPTFEIDELAILRHPAVFGRGISGKTLVKIGAPLALVAMTYLMLSLFAVLPSQASNLFPLAMFLLCIGVTFAIIPSTLRRRKFEHLFMHKYMEMGADDRVFVNRLTATCPWCNSTMQLRNVGEKNATKEDIFFCERNPRQHTVLLDPTALPPAS